MPNEKFVLFRIDEEYKKNMEKIVEIFKRWLESDCKQKNFPSPDDDDLDPAIAHILKYIDCVEPSWLDDSSNVEQSMSEIRNKVQHHNYRSDDMEEDDGGMIDDMSNDNDDSSIQRVNAYIGYQMINMIQNHKKEFLDILYAMTMLQLFFEPSIFKNQLAIFTRPLDLNEVSDIVGNNEYKIFDEKKYVNGLFHSEYLQMPPELREEKELLRFQNRDDLHNFKYDLQIHPENINTKPIQEQAEINFFSMVNPNHIRYHQNRFQPSQQFVTVIKNLINGLKKCNTPDDVKDFLNNKHNHVNPDDYTSMVLPAILSRVFFDQHNFQNRLFNEKNLKKYMDSYDSIMKQNKGARRFKEYDLLSTFKADKQGTIQFLEDFLSLRLVSDENAYISNHTLLVIFNIFDSRIYLDILYNVLPQSEKKGDFETEDGFVKTIRARINENSNKATPYTNNATKKDVEVKDNGDVNVDNTVQTAEELTESAYMMIQSLGNFDIPDIQCCHNLIQEAVDMELSTLSSKAFNHGLDESDLIEYFGESMNYVFQEVDKHYQFDGDVPNYMKDRISVLDKQGKPQTEIEETPLPEGVPANDINDLINSIEDRVDESENENGEPDLEYGFGKEAEVEPQSPTSNGKSDSHIVYNITYNYTNSNNTNTDSHNTVTTTDRSHNKTTGGQSTNTVDRSRGKTTGGQATRTTDMSRNKTTGGVSNNRYRRGTIDSHNIDYRYPQNDDSNNYYNDTSSTNTENQYNENIENEDTFSTGKSVQEVFDMLNSGEPLTFVEGASEIAGSAIGSFGADMGILPDYNPPPHEPLEVRLQDVDRKMLDKQQKAKKKLQSIENTAEIARRPFDRTHEWLKNFTDNLLAKDEDRVKAQLLEDKNYRTMTRKVFHTALDLGLLSTAFAISPYIGLLAVGKKGMDITDRARMKKEVQKDFVTEIQIIDDKIKRAHQDNKHEDAYKLERIKRKMVEKAASVTRDPIAKVQPLNPVNHDSYDYW